MRLIALVTAAVLCASPVQAVCSYQQVNVGAPCYNSSLPGADFSGRDLHSIYFDGSNLQGANFAGAKLRDARLAQTDLSRADLRGAHLDYADLMGANLANANLAGATLTVADLTRVNLANANLTGADLTYAKLSFTDLSGATWVDGTKCSSRSYSKCVPAIYGERDMAAPAATPIQPQAGLWRAAGDQGGSGYLFEATPAGLRLIVIGFDGLGAPVWSVAEGSIGPDHVFTSDLKHCTGAGTGPAECTLDLGPVTVAFDSPVSATILAPSAAPLRLVPSTAQ